MSTDPQSKRRKRTRMTSAQRREQLIGIARELFAVQGFDGTSVEEIAARADVSKPVVYEHFGGKEGLYAVVVDREVRALETAIHDALSDHGGYRQMIYRGTLALLDYIDNSPDGFRIISRDSAISPQSSTNFASILNDIASRVEDLIAEPMERHGYDARIGRFYAQGLVGMVAQAGQTWLDDRSITKLELASQLVNLSWNGLAHLKKQVPSYHQVAEKIN